MGRVGWGEGAAAMELHASWSPVPCAALKSGYDMVRLLLVADCVMQAQLEAGCLAAKAKVLLLECSSTQEGVVGKFCQTCDYRHRQSTAQFARGCATR